MSEEVIDLESNNLCITEDVFENFQVNSMYQEEEVLTLPSTSLGCTLASNVVSDTDGTTSVNNFTNDQINTDIELITQDKEQSEPEIILNSIDTGDDLQVQEEICVQTTNDDLESQYILTTDEHVELHVQSTDDCIEPQYAPSEQHDGSQDIQTTNEHAEFQSEEIAKEHIEIEKPMEVESQICGSELSENLETQIDTNTLGDPPTTTSEFIASNPIEQPASKQTKRRGRKKKITQNISNDMSIEDKMSLIHGLDDGLGQSTENNVDSSNFITLQPQRRSGRKKNSIQDSKIDTSTDSELISNENVCEQQENDLVSSGTQFKSQSFDETLIKNEPKRRGRKKKNSQPISILDTSTERQLNSNENKSNVQDILSHEPLITKGKRGRKPKNIQDKNLFDNCESSAEYQMSDSPMKTMSSEIEGYITPQKRGRRNNISSDEQVITLSDFELNCGNSATELDVPLSKLSKRRGRPKKISEETEAKIHQPSEIESSSNLNEGNIVAELTSPAKNSEKRRRGRRPKRMVIEQAESSDKHEESVAQTEMPSSTSTDIVKTDISNEHESLLDGDDIDDICLSNLRKTLDSKCNETENVPVTNDNETPVIENDTKLTQTKRNSKMSVMTDFEYNMDNIVNEDADLVKKENVETVKEGKNAVPVENDKNEIDESLLVEDSSRRPTRRRIKQNLHYDEESDEDPFANVELSDDDEPRGKKGSRYYSDDEYIPHRKGGKRNATDSSSNTECELEEESKKQKRKRTYSRKDVSLNNSPRKKGKINILDDVEENLSMTVPPTADVPIEGDIEVCLETSVIKTSEINIDISPETNEEDSENPAWGTTNEFENFIAKKIQGTALKIKKVSSDQSSVTIPPIEIPTMDAKDIHKTVEMCTQTSTVHTKTSSVQTASFDDVPMKENVPLSKEQSIKACEFLNGIVKTTAELGVLMTQKSEDFMKKKINTSNVTDTFKMDYCVKKSFLLFKLAKRNLMQMEEDLANQYDQFLKKNQLDAYREEIKTITATAKVESDSDCEIIEETISKLPVQPKKKPPKFNPKTVFLNKELSIKIAKKPTDEKKLNIKGKHSVWINDSVILKKVKPTQSFLAQDSRNKKPPDCKFTEIMNEFFRNYNRQKALSVCAPFVTTEWLFAGRNYVCNYFVAKPDDFPTKSNFSENESHFMNSPDSRTNSNPNVNGAISQLKHDSTKTSPKTLFCLCCASIQKQIVISSINTGASKTATDFLQRDHIEPESLFRLCLNTLNATPEDTLNDDSLKSPMSLKTMSYDDLGSPISLKTMADDDLESLMSVKSISFVDYISPLSLQTLSYMKVLELLSSEGKSTELTTNIASTSGNILQIKEIEHTATQVSKPDETKFHGVSMGKILEEKNGIKTLFTLCVDFIQRKQISNMNSSTVCKHFTPMSLKYISYKKIVHCLYGFRTEDPYPSKYSVNDNSTMKIVSKLSTVDLDEGSKKCLEEDLPTWTEMQMLNTGLDKIPRSDLLEDQTSMTKVKTLSNICLETIISLQSETNIGDAQSLTINSVNTMSEEAFLNIEETINSVNTMSEEAFLNIVETSQLENQYFDTSDCENDFEPEYDFEESVQNAVLDESNWVTRVQMGELKSEILSSLSNNVEKPIQNESTVDAPCDIPEMVHIKCEPQDDFSNNVVDPSIVKSEVDHTYDDLVITLENVTTKAEKDCSAAAKDHIQRRNSYDVDSFENFVSTNKLMVGTSEEIYSQSALRIRRQHEPDSDDENDLNMSLLIPHTSIPLPVDNAKNTLMESSSDDNNSKELTTKKKIDKRKKRTKKVETKQNNKDISNTTKNKSTLSNETSVTNNEVAILTRRMRERIRQEEKKIESSDSDTETRSLRSKADKKKGEQRSNSKQNTSCEMKQSQQCEENEIQCNNVDSTEQISENIDKSIHKQKDIIDNGFTGFTAVDQNAITNYQKYIQDIYNKILPQCDSPVTYDNELQSCSVNMDEPVEYLECEPTLPIFEDEVKKKSSKKKDKAKRKNQNVDDVAKLETSENNNLSSILKESEIINELSRPEESEIVNELSNQEDVNILSKANDAEASESQTQQFIERHGWHCYPIDTNDSKIYEHCQIPLDKLPESFVEMYFRYQDLTDQRKEDEEVDRLINLQSLNRLTFTKDTGKSKMKVKVKTEPAEDMAEPGCSGGSRAASPGSDHYRELTASEDEQENIDVEMPPPVPVPSSENNLAKDSLMDDNESDTDAPVNKQCEDAKVEPNVEAPLKRRPGPKSKCKVEDVKPANPEVRRRPGPKSKCKVEEVKTENPELMLTADKMMKEELTLLHAPIVLDEKVEPPQTKCRTRRKKIPTKTESERSHIKAEDEESSEEEKQWVTTKEKLLKRLEKRHDTANADDAKRAKLVSEFIERREGAEPRPKQKRRRSRKMTRKFLERQKQLSVLSRELFGESSDGVYAGKRSVTSYSKGRRNIRKVLDKKSLGRSTVLANMEEFERKRRLNIRQARLRELLGCEEGVNVLVINDELCLEYDFEEQQPVVTVHPFFTKIMKAHQYEGVKFMWDACFESLAHIAAGHPGGGCILAHCMGLGKTLQVLALLHTVLTHPGVGMQRVLVCCPLSTVLNWVDEIHKWIGPVTNQMKVFELSKLKKTYERAYQLEDWYNGGGIFIIGYELFRSLTTLDPFLDDIRPTIINKIRTALLDPGPDIIICDEGHLLKNDLSVLAVAMSRVVTKRRIVLTGTPMQNNLREYYCMVNFVKPNLLGTYAEYSNRFENPIMNGQHRDSSAEDIKLMKARTHILHKVLEGCLQRQEASVLYPYLPKKYEYTVFISLTQCQWDLYKHYLTAYGNKNKQSVLKDFHALQKIWSHPQVLHNFQTRVRDQNAAKVKEEKLEDDLAREELAAEAPDIKPADTEVWWLPYLEGGAKLDSLDASNKFVVVFRILDECMKLGDKVLIFSTSLFTMDALEYFLRKINKWSLGQEYYRLDGSVPAEVRQKWCREFNAENNIKTKLFLISTRAGCLGLNMTAANRVIILDTSWNPAHDIQSIFRVYRFGQKKDCYIYRLVALGTMEQKIYERSVTKQAVSCRVVDEQQIDRHYNMAELTELYRFDEEGSGVESGVAAGVRDVALLRVARLRALHAVHEHDSLLRGSEPALPEHERQAAWVQFQYQQEHEHMQMQNELVGGNVAKRPNARVAKLSNVKMLKMEPNTQDPDFKPEPKKRGRKPRAQMQGPNGAPEPMEAAPQDDFAIDPKIEEDKIKKIAEILVKYNFQDMQMQTMLPQLVMNVRRMVAVGQRNGSVQCDELTASIANILLERPDITMPTVTDIMCKSVNKSIFEQQPEQSTETPEEDNKDAIVKLPIEQPTEQAIQKPIEKPIEAPPVKKYKPGPKCKKGYVYEEIPMTTTQSKESEYDVRAKRRAALAAERLLETANESVVDLDDDEVRYDDVRDDGSDTDSVPEMTLRDLAKKPTLANKLQALETQPTQSPIAEKAPKLKAKKSRTKRNNTITLSDDESSPTVETAVEEDSETTPLHPSLLQNANFIKIVAHTYLAGNPMLDEDAATLAARYSTYKALKEFESTGKPITNGPIYDIAVKVLGIDILKKLHKTDTKLGAQSSLTLPSEQPEVEQNETNKSGPKSRRSGRGASKASKGEFPPPPAAAATTRPVPATLPPLVPAPPRVHSNVVPVGLYKTTISMPTGGPKQEAVEESILPDDEDVHIVSSPPPAAPRGTKPIVVRAVRAGRLDLPKASTSVHTTPALPPQHTPPTPTPPVLPPASVALAPPPPRDYGTICLDSDEEDDPPPAPVPVGTWYTPPKPNTPVPVSAAPPAIATAPLPPIVRLASRAAGPASRTRRTLTGDPATIILTKPCNRPPHPGPDAMNQNNRASQPPTRIFMIPSSSVASMNPPLIPISVSPATMTHPQMSLSQHQIYQHAILPDTIGAADNSESILPTPTPTAILPTPTSNLPTSTSTSSTSTSILPTPTYGAPTVTPVPPFGPKKVHRKHDVIRIGKYGQVELINRSGDVKLLEKTAAALKTAEPKIGPKPASKPIEPKIVHMPAQKETEIPKTTPKSKTTEVPKTAPAPASKTSELPPSVTSKSTKLSLLKEKREEAVKKASASKPPAPARVVSSDSSDDSRPASPARPGDPLDILKDVVHIQADQYVPPKPAPPVVTAPNRKCFALREGNSASSAAMSTSETASVKLPVNNPAPKPTSTAPKKKLDVSKLKGFSDLVLESVDLTDSGPSTPPDSTVGKKTDLKAKTSTSKTLSATTLPSTSKNTPSAAKIIRVKTEKGVLPKAGPKSWIDGKKRAAPSVDINPPKKKKLDQLMTLEDFDIDDIDDIIELD